MMLVAPLQFLMPEMHVALWKMLSELDQMSLKVAALSVFMKSFGFHS